MNESSSVVKCLRHLHVSIYTCTMTSSKIKGIPACTKPVDSVMLLPVVYNFWNIAKPHVLYCMLGCNCSSIFYRQQLQPNIQ